MFYGLWRYWGQAKKELLTLGSAFGLLFAFITLLAMVAFSGALNKENKNIFAVGVQNAAGSLSYISPNISEILDDLPRVKARLLWSQNINQVDILGEEKNLTIVFTNSQYISMLKPRFLNGAQQYRCNPKCTLIGAAVASKYAQAESIKVGDQHYEVTAVFNEQSFEFPDGIQADIILDVSQFSLASNMSQVITMLAANFPDVSEAQIAEFIPAYRTLIEMTSLHDLARFSEQIQEAYNSQKHLFSNIRRVISLAGSDDQTLGLIQGSFFDQKAKDNTLLMQMLFLVAAVQLFLVTLVNLVSMLTRFNLMRSHENTTRYALGAYKWRIFKNNIYFIQPVMLFAAAFGMFCLGGLHALSSPILKAHLGLTLPPLLNLYLAYTGLIVLVAFCLPGLINLKVLLSGLKTEKVSLTRTSVLQIRSLNIVLFTLAIISIFLASSTFSHWQALKQRGTKSILETAHIIELDYYGKGPVSPTWESVIQDISQRVPGVGFLGTLPGNRNLSFTSLQFNDETCQTQFGGWKNGFYGDPFNVITGQNIQTEHWGAQDIAVSKSILDVCGFDATEVLDKYLQDTDNNRYQIRAVVEDVLYDMHVGSPPQVIYFREVNLSNFRNILFSDQVDLNKLSSDLEQELTDYNLQMNIKEKGSLIHYMSSQLNRESTTMMICFILMGLSLCVLFLAFAQHISKVLSIRNREWGTRRAIGANKRQLSRDLIIELLQEWSVALIISALFAVFYTHLQAHLLSAHILATIASVLFSATVVFMGAAYYLRKELSQASRLMPANLLRSAL